MRGGNEPSEKQIFGRRGSRWQTAQKILWNLHMPPVDVDFVPARYPPEAFSYSYMMRSFGVSRAEAKRHVQRLKAEQVVLSATHQVAITKQQLDGFDVVWLSIKRRDRSPILHRMELAPIADALMPHRVALELLPAPVRLVDTANHYHLQGIAPSDLDALPGTTLTSPPHLGDWRELFAWKESLYPGRDAALIVAGSPRAGHVLVAPDHALFPFGFQRSCVLNEGIGGAVQRPLKA